MNPAPTIRISLTKPALDALLEKQPEAMVDITNGVIEQFCKQNFVKLAEDSQIRLRMAELMYQAKNDILQEIGIANSNWRSREEMQISPEHKVKVQELIKKAADGYIREAIEKELAAIDQKVKDRVSYLLYDIVKKSVDTWMAAYTVQIKETLSQSISNAVKNGGT